MGEISIGYVQAKTPLLDCYLKNFSTVKILTAVLDGQIS